MKTTRTPHSCRSLFFLFILLTVSDCIPVAQAAENKRNKVVKISNLDALEALTTLAHSKSDQTFRSIQARLAEAHQWLKTHPQKAGQNSLDLSLVAEAGFQIQLRKDYDLAKDVKTAHETSQSPLLFGNEKALPKKADLWIIEFTSLLNGGYVAYVDCQTGRVLAIKTLFEG